MKTTGQLYIICSQTVMLRAPQQHHFVFYHTRLQLTVMGHRSLCVRSQFEPNVWCSLVHPASVASLLFSNIYCFNNLNSAFHSAFLCYSQASTITKMSTTNGFYANAQSVDGRGCLNIDITGNTFNVRDENTELVNLLLEQLRQVCSISCYLLRSLTFALQHTGY